MIAITPPVAQAAQADCTLSTSDFAALQAIQNNPAFTPNQELSQELALRKQLLAATITCAVNDAQSLQTTLKAVSAPDSESATIQSQISSKIGDTLNFYSLESAKLNDAGINSTENIAKEIIAWRTANYDPLVNQTNNFILWSQNQAIFQTAQDRLAQTIQVVNFIESAAANNNIQAGLSAARSALENAQDQNQDAESAMAEFLPPDQTLALIQQSLQSLANAYQQFTNLNNLIQAVLPTQQ